MPVTTFSFADGIVNTQEILSHFQENGFVILEEALTTNEIKYYADLFDQDQRKWGDWLFYGILLVNTKPETVMRL